MTSKEVKNSFQINNNLPVSICSPKKSKILEVIISIKSKCNSIRTIASPTFLTGSNADEQTRRPLRGASNPRRPLVSPAGGRSCNPKIIGEFRVRFEAETNKELTFSPSFQIDNIDIDWDEELGGYLTSRRRGPRR